MATLGSRMRALRLENGLTQGELSKVINVSTASISSYEKDNATPELQSIHKLADYFEVSADYLLGRSDIRNPYQPKVLAAHSEADEFSQADLDDIERVLEMIRRKKMKD